MYMCIYIYIYVRACIPVCEINVYIYMVIYVLCFVETETTSDQALRTTGHKCKLTPKGPKMETSDTRLGTGVVQSNCD